MAVIAELMARVGVNTKGVDQGTSKIESKFDKTWRNVKRGAAIGGAAIGTAMAVGLVKAMEREASTDKLAAQINLDPNQQAMAGKIAGDVYAQAYGESIQDVNNTFAAVFREVGDVGEDELARITEHAQRFGDVFGTDTVAAVKTAGALVKNDVAPDMVGAFDTIAAAAQEVNMPAEELLDNLNEYAEPLGSLGIDGPTSIGLINSAMDAGVRNTDKALDAMKEFAIRTIDGSEASAEAFDSLGLDAEKMANKIAEGGPTAKNATSEIIQALMGMEDPLEQDAAGVALFGTMWEDLGPKAIAALDPMASSMEDVSGRSENLDVAFDNNATRIEEWKRQIDEWLIGLAEAPGALGTAGAAAVGFGSFAADSGGNIGMMALSMGAMTKGAGKLVKGMGSAAKATAAFGVSTAKATGKVVASTAALIAKKIALVASKVAIVAVTAVQWLWNIALTANPIGLIIIAIAALIAIVILLVVHWDTVVAFLKKAWEFIKDTAISVWGAIKDFFADTWDTIKKLIAVAIEKVKGIFLKFHPLGIIIRNWEPIKSFITDTWDDILSFLSGLPRKISSRVSGMFDSFKTAFKSAINFIIRGWNNLSFTAPKVDLGPLGSFGGFTIGTPNIPMLGSGGIATGPVVAMLGEESAHEAIIPLPPGVRDLGDLTVGGDGEEMNPEFDVRVFIGDKELTDIVDVQIKKRSRKTKRKAKAGAGVAR